MSVRAQKWSDLISIQSMYASIVLGFVRPEKEKRTLSLLQSRPSAFQLPLSPPPPSVYRGLQ